MNNNLKGEDKKEGNKSEKKKEKDKDKELLEEKSKYDVHFYNNLKTQNKNGNTRPILNIMSYQPRKKTIF
jgi:hypothetical protein